MNTQRQGFTIVELMIVIIVIGILTTITMVGISRFQADARDARRSTSITTIAEALEKYYDQNGEYPNCAAIGATANTVSTDTLKGISTSALIAPQAPSGTANSLSCTVTATTNGTDVFQYIGDGTSPCTNSTGACLRYSLRYKSEGQNTIIQVDSRR